MTYFHLERPLSFSGKYFYATYEERDNGKLYHSTTSLYFCCALYALPVFISAVFFFTHYLYLPLLWTTPLSVIIFAVLHCRCCLYLSLLCKNIRPSSICCILLYALPVFVVAVYHSNTACTCPCYRAVNLHILPAFVIAERL